MKIFIAHRGEDSSRAIELRQTLMSNLNLQEDDVFISSDSKSIPTGTAWFSDIIRNIDNSIVVIALLTNGWKNRPWIPFESAYGLGRDKKLCPVVYEDNLKNDHESPFFHLQTKNLANTSDFNSFISEVRLALEGGVSLPQIIPFISGDAANPLVKFYLVNPSRRRYNVRTVEVFIPTELINVSQYSVDPTMVIVDDLEVDWVAYKHHRFISDIQVVNHYFETRPLTTVLNPNERKIELPALQCRLKPELVKSIGNRSKILTKLNVNELDPIEGTFIVSDLEGF